MSSYRSFTVRYAEPSDFDAVNSIHKTAYPDDNFTYANNIGVRDIINLVAESDGRAVGFITVLLKKWNPSGRSFWERASPYVGFIGVNENYRRLHGINPIKGFNSIILITFDNKLHKLPNIIKILRHQNRFFHNRSQILLRLNVQPNLCNEVSESEPLVRK